MNTLRKILLILLLSPFSLQIWAQNKFLLSGKVTDANGAPLPQVTIAVENTTLGTYSDNQGKYSLQLKSGNYTVVVSYIGYETIRQEVDLKKNRSCNFKLKESSVSLNSVEVYGKTKSQQIKEGALAVNALDVAPIVNSITNLSDLVNRTSGIKVREEGGVGSDFDLYINGLSGNSIRYFLDGVPLDTKGTGVTLANLPVNIIDRVEIYKGVVPASLGTDALGGAINIITKQDKTNYLDASYGTGSFHTHRADLNAQYVVPKIGLIVKPTIGINYSQNDYMMKGVELWDEESRKYLPTNRRRFHDDYLSALGQIEFGFTDKPWADAFYVSASYSKVNKELQTGSVQTAVYGKAEKESEAWNIAARYQKNDFIVKKLNAHATLSHTWDHSITTDTAYRQYDWNGDYIVSSRNEITGKSRSIRHYKRPMTIIRTNLDYQLAEKHNISANYMLSRTGNDRYDDFDETFVPSNDVLAKHIVGLSYNQTLWEGKMENTFFVKEYINHLNIEQKDLSSVTGSDELQGSTTKKYTGYGVGSRFTLFEQLAIKASYEHSVRLPLARELLGNATTIYPNIGLKPENSDNVNLGIFGTWHPAKGHTLYYESNGFLRYVDDYIQATVSPKEGMMQYENVPAVHVKGVDGEIRYDWNSNLQLSANISYQDARNQRKYKSDGKPSATYKNKVPNRPWVFGGAEACYTFHNIFLPQSKLRLGMNYQWVHWYYLTWEAFGAKENKAQIPTQHICNANLTYSWADGRYNVSVECSNFLDKLAYDNYKLQKPGRAFFAKFRLFIH